MWPLFAAISTRLSAWLARRGRALPAGAGPRTCPGPSSGLGQQPGWTNSSSTQLGERPMFDFQDLFQWDRFITPTIIKTFYWLVIGLIVLFGISGIFSGLAAMAISPVRRLHPAVVLDRRRDRRHRVLAHRRRIHPDRVPHQRAPRRHPRPGRRCISIRHCEQSEAIQSPRSEDWIASSLTLLAMTTRRRSATY